uniref:Uncharacterized protein n=1 Tax=Parascaris equorum TaxID=6256 RepID=A0A914SJU1_PAREQ
MTVMNSLKEVVSEPPEAKANVEKQQKVAKPPSPPPPPPPPPNGVEKVKEDTPKPNPEDDQVCHPLFKRLVALFQMKRARKRRALK